MSDIYADPIRHPYEASYPPSVWGGGPVTPPTNVYPDGVTPGQPGTFTTSTGSPIDIPDDLPDLQALGALGQTTAWATDDFVTLEDATAAHWDGAAWAQGPAPAPPPPPAPSPDSSWTKAEIVAWLNDHGDPAQDSLTKAELLDHVANILD